MEREDIRGVMLDTMIVSMEAQLKALKKLRSTDDEDEPRVRSKSQIDIVYDILISAGEPLHVSRIITEAQIKFGVTLERESLVSALSKKVMKEDRFVRTGKNTFALKAR